MKQCAKTGIRDWIVSATLAGVDETEIISGVCQRLSSEGMALVRCSVATSLRGISGPTTIIVTFQTTSISASRCLLKAGRRQVTDLWVWLGAPGCPLDPQASTDVQSERRFQSSLADANPAAATLLSAVIRVLAAVV